MAEKRQLTKHWLGSRCETVPSIRSGDAWRWRRRLLLTSGLMGKQKGDRKWVQDKDLKAHPQQLTS